MQTGDEVISELEQASRRSSNSKRKRSSKDAPRAGDVRPSRTDKAVPEHHSHSSSDDDGSESSTDSASSSASSSGSSRTNTGRAPARHAGRPPSTDESHSRDDDDEVVTVEPSEITNAQLDPIVNALFDTLPCAVQQNIDKCVQAYHGERPYIFMRLLVKAAMTPSPLPHVKIRELAYLAATKSDTSRADIETLIYYYNNL